jgi:hypothetical protein
MALRNGFDGELTPPSSFLHHTVSAKLRKKEKARLCKFKLQRDDLKVLLKWFGRPMEL